MIPILTLNDNLELSGTGKAYKVEFESRRNGKPLTAWVAVSQSKIEKGMLWVADWITEPHRDGIMALIRAGHKCLNGEPVEVKIEHSEAPKAIESAIKKGYFTVVAQDGKRYTFKFKTTPKMGTMIGLLVGSSNTSDYAWFGSVTGDTLRFWKGARYQGGYFKINIEQDTLKECFQAILGNAEEAGLRYAMEYNNCSRCGKVLTVPESIKLGLGPECASLKYGGK